MQATKCCDPQGYAPATFQRLMQRTLVGMSKFCSVYIDDILENEEEHIEHLRQVHVFPPM